MTEKGTLDIGEPHPAAKIALDYVRSIPYIELIIYQESFSSLAIEGNRLSEVCSETLNRLLTNQSVSDRYLLGLAWTIRDLEGDKNET